MESGRHYCEILITRSSTNTGFGVIPPGLEHDKAAPDEKVFFLRREAGALWGHDKFCEEETAELHEGDRLGIMLDLDRHSVSFFVNGDKRGPGFPRGVTGPLVFAAELGGGDELELAALTPLAA